MIKAVVLFLFIVGIDPDSIPVHAMPVNSFPYNSTKNWPVPVFNSTNDGINGK